MRIFAWAISVVRLPAWIFLIRYTQTKKKNIFFYISILQKKMYFFYISILPPPQKKFFYISIFETVLKKIIFKSFKGLITQNFVAFSSQNIAVKLNKEKGQETRAIFSLVRMRILVWSTYGIMIMILIRISDSISDSILQIIFQNIF